MKIGDLIIRKYDDMLAIVVNTDRLHTTGIITVQYYGVPKEVGYGGWHCDDVAETWRLQNESR